MVPQVTGHQRLPAEHGECSGERLVQRHDLAAVSTKCMTMRFLTAHTHLMGLRAQRLSWFFTGTVLMHKAVIITHSPAHRKLPKAPLDWDLRARSLPCHSHWKIQVLGKVSCLLTLLTIPQQRGTPDYNSGLHLGKVELPIIQIRKWGKNPDSWTHELFVFPHWMESGL